MASQQVIWRGEDSENRKHNHPDGKGLSIRPLRRFTDTRLRFFAPSTRGEGAEMLPRLQVDFSRSFGQWKEVSEKAERLCVSDVTAGMDGLLGTTGNYRRGETCEIQRQFPKLMVVLVHKIKSMCC